MTADVIQLRDHPRFARTLHRAAPEPARELPPRELPLVGKYRAGDRIIDHVTRRRGVIVKATCADGRFLIHITEGHPLTVIRAAYQLSRDTTPPPKPCA